jgi:hypothetical protein
MNMDDVAAELVAVLDSIRQQRVTIAGIASSFERTRGRLLALTYGSQHLLVHQMLGAWGAALQRLREADELLAGCAVALIGYMTAIGVGVEGKAVAGGGTVPGAPAERPATATALAKRGSGPPIPAHVQRLGDRLTPWRSGEDTLGYAYDSARRPPEDERFVSGRVESAAEGLAGRYRLVRTFTDHIEGMWQR